MSLLLAEAAILLWLLAVVYVLRDEARPRRNRWLIDEPFIKAMNGYMMGGLEGEQPLPTKDGRRKLDPDLLAAMARGWAPADAPMFIHPDGSTLDRRRNNP